MQLINNVKRL